jgi:hypothetical protein
MSLFDIHEGDICIYCGLGTVEIAHEGEGCTCFLGYPPCGYCLSSYLLCSNCGQEYGRDDET